MRNQVPVDDDVGLTNPVQRFTISNDKSQLEGVNYQVDYTISLIELNKNVRKQIDKEYIKFRYTKTDSKGKKTTSDITRLSSLKKQSDGKYLLLKDNQAKGATDKYEFTFWIASDAGNDQQNAAYIMAFKVEAGITVK